MLPGLTRTEAHAILDQLHGARWLIASLLYEAGLRLRECLKLRIKDADFEYRQITVRDGKGTKDRVTMLPVALVLPLKEHLVRVRALHDRDLASGHGDVELPGASPSSTPGWPTSGGWKFVFPSHKLSTDPSTGSVRHHHVYENYLIRAAKEAV